MNKGKAIVEGKSKILFETDHPEKHLLLHYKDDATGFNGAKKGTIPSKGIVNNTVSSWIYRYLEKKGIETHLVEKIGDRESLVSRVEIIPVEVVIRNRAAGSFCKRFGVEKGAEMNPPLVEYFYKSDELNDPPISETIIEHFKWATKDELALMTNMAFKVNEILSAVFSEIGLVLVDYKLEFGRNADGKLILADEFTADGCRLWDKETGESMDKDRFRFDMGGVEEAYQEVYLRLEKYFEGKI